MFVIWGMALGLYYSFFFKFSAFFALPRIYVGLTFALFHIAYFALAIPAAVFNRQYGYKLGFLFGLSAFALGAFLLYLAIIQQSRVCFLAAVATMGASGAWLDSSLNPLVVESGRAETSLLRLNLAQAFNAFGLLIGYVVAISLFDRHFQLTVGLTSHLSARPYVLIGLGAILLAFFVEQITLPSFATRRAQEITGIGGEFRTILRDRTFLIAAASMCACCAVLTILWSSNYRYHLSELPGQTVPLFERGFFWFAVGRCAGALLMMRVDPIRVLQTCAVLCLTAVVITAVTGGTVGWVSLLCASAFLSVLYPTVLGSALSPHRTRMALAAGLLVMAAGIGSALSALAVHFALEIALVNPHVVIGVATPLLAIVLAYAVAFRGRRLQLRS